MTEAAKRVTIARRLAHGLLPLIGNGIDVGAGPPDKREAWWTGCVSGTVRSWDREDGDAHTLPGVELRSQDWLFASHILEHLERPAAALKRWVEVVKPFGRILISVPHRDLYEGQLELPSHWAPEHKRFYLPGHSDGEPGTYGFGDFLKAHQHYGYRVAHLEMGDRDCVPASVRMNRHATGEYCIDALLLVD